jgi:hypothetical protein
LADVVTLTGLDITIADLTLNKPSFRIVCKSIVWQNQPELYRLKYASPFLRAPTCFKRYNPLAYRVTSR